ncbi:hypothetical protein P691DRAFT_719266 [Macrolepiota fuliginosa MF-IS2]|uniref:Uncharacterized protein n=1 Tax=Macrolepiota fuliginosa MF-IS2 TaxID=1400762 RepID=A0A9P5XL73_9AGAR|nr:hypothetical protein P691DRAFT_719266 [Macrolepiota fuliginosa MF-IS2]
MSLDQNLFTLQLTPHKDYPNVTDLVDPSGTLHYRKQRLAGSEYKIEVYDPLSESLLITATGPSATSKLKKLELCNPTQVVELKYTGTISFRWGFRWEEHDFEWKREECFMLRKPDPPVLVAVTKEPSGRLKTSTVQILDYNLNRFDINDRKGLEIVILTALLTFSDSNESYHAPPAPPTNNSIPASSSDKDTASSTKMPPKPPPKPAPKTGIDRIAELQAARGEYNEVTVEDEGSIQDYAQYCSNLLSDDAMLFVTVKSEEAIHVPKVLQVVEETKRIRHKAGISEEEELHQYVLYDTKPEKKGPRRINLDDNDKGKNKNKYAPPNSLTIHLSKISMPELQPKHQPGDKGKKEQKKAPPIPSQPSTHSLPKVKSQKLMRPPPESLPNSSHKHNRSHSHSPQPPHPPYHSKPRSSVPDSMSPSNLNVPQFPVPWQGPQHGGALNTHPHSTSPPSPRPYPAPASAGPHPSSNYPPWASPAGQGQSKESKPNVVSSLFDRLHLR